ncbi:hypothetical protein HUK80_06770 [Flavobacterium sp. MAH-1]|uniref:Bacterial Pleckstrin homology domain-containing protein n=1 Tax=Flavobacterium agri TaxID=2743471 RepID=A0A7Y8Y1C2_9FLAO|nr:PH domain-containing protein [Flavobacterium agri]NUY80591.1 hypothetical protein [Flavobacterium agri]NYA70615.1 hypothetical protein [Flavobacterium agri]
MKKYTASLDLTAKIITVCVAVVLITIAVSVWVAPEDGEGIRVRIWVTCMMTAILTLGFSFAPTRFALGDEGITIRRFWTDVFIPFDKIKSARKVEKIPSKGLIRTMGSGGFFGYYGYFSNTEFGAMKWYVTHRSNVIMIEVGSEKVLISPDEEDDFLAVLRQKTNFE